MPFQPWVGELMLVASAGNPPKGWALCDGQMLSVSQNRPLFALLGNAFGGDGVNTFALPDLQGRVPVCAGQGAGLQNYTVGQTGGASMVTLTANQLPAHTHTVACNSENADTGVPDGAYPGPSPSPLYAPQPDGTLLSSSTLSLTPNQPTQAHNNVQPSLCLQWMISLTGDLPFGAA